MAWTTIPNSNLEPGAPARSVDAIALRDNPIAIAQRDSGAPRVQPSTIVRLNSSGTFTVPDGVTRIKVWVVGGGAGGSSGVGTGGGGGTAIGVIDVSPAQDISYTVGSGGGTASNGGSSSFSGLTGGGGRYTGRGGNASGGDANIRGNPAASAGGGSACFGGGGDSGSNGTDGGGAGGDGGTSGGNGFILVEY